MKRQKIRFLHSCATEREVFCRDSVCEMTEGEAAEFLKSRLAELVIDESTVYVPEAASKPSKRGRQ